MDPQAELAGPNENPVPHQHQYLRCWLIRNQPLEDYPGELPSVTEYAAAISQFFGEGEGKTMPVVPDTQVSVQTTDQVIHRMVTMYAGSRYLTRCNMAAMVFQKHAKEWPNYNDTPIHQRYGPVNALITEQASISDKHERTICTRYGGCRMLSCQEFEVPDDDGSVEWFTGECIHCKQAIDHKESAVRIPQLSGGWRGCFCEWYCVYDYIASAGYNEHDQELLEDLVGRFSLQLDYTPIV